VFWFWWLEFVCHDAAQVMRVGSSGSGSTSLGSVYNPLIIYNTNSSWIYSYWLNYPYLTNSLELTFFGHATNNTDPPTEFRTRKITINNFPCLISTNHTPSQTDFRIQYAVAKQQFRTIYDWYRKVINSHTPQTPKTHTLPIAVRSIYYSELVNEILKEKKKLMGMISSSYHYTIGSVMKVKLRYFKNTRNAV